MEIKANGGGHPKKKILLIGPYPPPYGGVSVHIARFINLLKNEFSFDFIDESPLRKSGYFNLRSLKLFTYLKKVINAEVLYIHSGNNLVRIFHLVAGKLFLKKIILVLHGFNTTPPKFVFFLSGIIYRLANRIVLVNPVIKDSLFLPEKKCIIKEAFLPPLLKEESPLPGNISELLTRCKQEGKTIICGNAFRLETYKNQDLYGLDMCIEVSRRLSKENFPFVFLFVVASIDQNTGAYPKNESIIEESNLKETFFLINQKLSFVKLMEKSDIVVRPTNTDGDSLTIREGLFLNKKVLASDVVDRPEGVHLFQNRDIDDLEKKLKLLIKEDNINELAFTDADYNKSVLEFKRFYSDLLTNVN